MAANVINYNTVVVRGGGDLATGIIQKLWRAGFNVAILDIPRPLAIRRTVALCSAVWESAYTVEDVTACTVDHVEDCPEVWRTGRVPLLIDPAAVSLQRLKPVILIDAIIAKRNIGTNKHMAPITIALGPGFSAPEDVDCVIETMRGHDLGKLITKGRALPNTGIPGEIGGKTAQRVVHAPFAGKVVHVRSIGSFVQEGDCLFTIDSKPVYSPLTGVVRGLISEGLWVPQGLKCADVDPRSVQEVDWNTISDKARCLGGAALEACLYLARQKGISLGVSAFAEPFVHDANIFAING